MYVNDLPFKQVHRRIICDLRHFGGFGVFIDFLRAGLLQDTPLVHHDDFTAQLHRFHRVCGRINQDRIFRRFGAENILELFAQLFAQFIIQIDQRLIQQQDAGLFDQRPRQRNALLLTAGKRLDLAVFKPLKPHLRQRLHHPGINLGHRQFPLLEREGHVVIDCQMRVIDKLLVHHRDLTLPHRDSAKIGPVERHLAAVGADQTGNGFQ